ncbi:PE domain-containing protein [Mycobacterium sp. 236(2023)]|uniref:PE domain-containing protein n=1 Tax=Mycobacterium sp. 236(2023) TaxID=3038163 RepID=UPI002414D872|nr:PE domain-containing protein [Mycobacterium sp. 236(2023)]MDG4667961.1 PE domain-containing protein [Mycobacterium sp. 236(2023)]
MADLMGVNPALLALQSAIESSGVGTQFASTAGAAPVVCAVLPPGGDGASAAAAAGLCARGAAAVAMLSEITTGRALFADTVAVSGISYVAQDVANMGNLAL